MTTKRSTSPYAVLDRCFDTLETMRDVIAEQAPRASSPSVEQGARWMTVAESVTSTLQRFAKTEKPPYDRLRAYLATNPDLGTSDEASEALTLLKYASRGPEGAQAHVIANKLLIKAAVDCANEYLILEPSIVQVVDLIHWHLADTLRLHVSGGEWDLPTIKAEAANGAQ